MLKQVLISVVELKVIKLILYIINKIEFSCGGFGFGPGSAATKL